MLNIGVMASFITYLIFLYFYFTARMNTEPLFLSPSLFSLMQTSALEVWYKIFFTDVYKPIWFSRCFSNTSI